MLHFPAGELDKQANKSHHQKSAKGNSYPLPRLVRSLNGKPERKLLLDRRLAFRFQPLLSAATLRALLRRSFLHGKKGPLALRADDLEHRYVFPEKTGSAKEMALCHYSGIENHCCQMSRGFQRGERRECSRTALAAVLSARGVEPVLVRLGSFRADRIC